MKTYLDEVSSESSVEEEIIIKSKSKPKKKNATKKSKNIHLPVQQEPQGIQVSFH
jgi:hypothetical protein